MKKYLAVLQFQDACADASSNNLKKLRQRIKNNFAGEKTEWGYVASGPIQYWAIYCNGKKIEESTK